MKSSTVDAALALAALILGAASMVRWADGSSTDIAPQILPAIEGLPRPTDAASLDITARRAIARNPFRLSRLPATVPYSPSGGAAPPSPPPLRPTFVLKGIIGGPPFQAIVDGIPGAAAGQVIRRGDVFDKLIVRSIDRGRVVIVGPDTNWTLTLPKVGK
jgi:hypothetical protein